MPDRANAPAAPPAASIPSKTHFLCDLWLLADTCWPVDVGDFCVMTMVCICSGLEGAASDGDGAAGFRLAAEGRAFASMVFGVAARAGGAVSGADFAGVAGRALAGAVFVALAAGGGTFLSALALAMFDSPMRWRTTMPARAWSFAAVMRTLNDPASRLS